MIEVLKTGDPVRLHFLKSLLEAADIQVFVFEGGSPWPGAFPARLMVPEAEADMARRLIAEAEA
ncbi:MAG TPA: DUF2007 domain-containing protein [Phenylobacterium sp.]|uniref:putative signal transducing protein n=1 Tax=Phenylobacterium sp. TaxID=1871053 RepID=UPI002B957241|nr:DUF2007 domain-containing protein [Phenylobacterium sp.]HSV03905.1 DUF2007 domain-containing protein [Phenylobacterium sp.]